MAKKKTRTKTASFGACEFDRITPEGIAEDAKGLKLVIGFVEALKLSFAIQECLRKLNSYNRSTKHGRAGAVELTLYLDKRRVVVYEGVTTNQPTSRRLPRRSRAL